MVKTASNEQYGFVFAVTYILLFSVIIATIPADLQGQGATPDMITPLDPTLISGFSESETYGKANLTAFGQLVYIQGGFEWVFSHYVGTMQLGAKVFIGGVLWLGQLDSAEFISSEGVNRGYVLSIAEITEDATNGTIRYSLRSLDSGNSMGGFVVYWNTTTYSDPSDAWDNEELYLLHGMGIEETAIVNIGSLLLDLLFLQLPDVPFLLSIITIGPLWASIIYIIWFIFVNMVPFLGGG